MLEFETESELAIVNGCRLCKVVLVPLVIFGADECESGLKELTKAIRYNSTITIFISQEYDENEFKKGIRPEKSSFIELRAVYFFCCFGHKCSSISFLLFRPILATNNDNLTGL